MSGARKQQRDPATQKLPRPPVDFTLGRLVYTSHMRPRRNRMYRLVAAFLILAVSTGVVVVLLANWLNTLVR